MQVPKFDWTVNFGHILTLIVLGATGITAFATYRVTVADHDVRLKFLEAQYQQQNNLNNILTTTMNKLLQDVAVVRDRMERK